MSILIKGMEMPKEIEPALVIEFCEDQYGKRYARFYHYRYGGLTDWHEILEVPEPHGRLIDADALIDGRVSNDNVVICAKNAPTIIPAELPVHHGTFAATSKEEALKRIIPAEGGE